ncbi:hypothetical protein OOT00_10180 [Desulfobotulus sp. H1]|uniref:Uncharacterized protein n=1 Tax=Desulfobotulus pelophilus TaxID=2823377 RepID=A0ABT3NA76_9BACT|nr:hypothetical protein [Desulfobotulus pelophilus]MCW7754353.1 hypothetical protein [Desulfobotulus pelophilus]
MEICWKIEKKRGNYRPVLSWVITLEPAEKELAMAPVAVDTGIPMPHDYWESHCYPDKNERRGLPARGAWEVITPSHKAARSEGRMVLPWRKDNLYPEVEEGFSRVRAVMEKALTRAAVSLPMNDEGKMELRNMAKKRLAAGLTADRMLSGVIQKVA